MAKRLTRALDRPWFFLLAACPARTLELGLRSRVEFPKPTSLLDHVLLSLLKATNKAPQAWSLHPEPRDRVFQLMLKAPKITPQVKGLRFSARPALKALSHVIKNG